MTRHVTPVHARFIGIQAKQTISRSDIASVMGNTSRGVFLKTKKWVIFLSYEGYRGPMTVNLKGDVAPLRELTTGGLVQITPGQISIPEADLRISAARARVWQPEPPSNTACQPAACQARLKAFASAAYEQKSGAGLSDLLPTLLDIPANGPAPNKNAQDFRTDILSIRQGLKRSDIPSTKKSINKILGRGAGLTPSGDDCLIGLLLTLNRWNAVLEIEADLQSFNTQVLSAAYEATTTLSANLIECAARGLADERLVKALDLIMTGEGEQESVLNQLLNWGNSSGVDALVGMVVGLSATLSR